MKKTLEIHLYPNVDNEGNKNLYLYCNNRGDTKVNLNQILVYSNNTLHINKKNNTVNPDTWFYIPIEIDKLSDNDTVILSWTGLIENEEYTKTESIKISDLEYVHKNITNITFN